MNDCLNLMNPKRKNALWQSILVSSALIASGCDVQSTPSSPNVAPSTINVKYRQMEPVSIPQVDQLPGRIVAYQISEVRPQVNGIIIKRLFNEGDLVTQGQPLYQLDSRLYTAAVKQAESNLQMSRASASAANALAARYAPLVKTQSISQQDYTTAVANAQQAQAAISQAEAMLEAAKINLEFSTITAPISGRIGRSFYTVGALVSANQSEALATIQQLDPVYVDIQQTAAQLMALRQHTPSATDSADQVAVQLSLEGRAYDKPGSLEFSEAVVDAETGSITLRARFPNPDNILLPGMFVQAELSQSVIEQAFLVPQSALQRDAKGNPMVYLVDAQNKVSIQPVNTNGTLKQDWIVINGLHKGDKVLTQGLVHVHAGDTVNALSDEVVSQLVSDHAHKSSEG